MIFSETGDTFKRIAIAILMIAILLLIILSALGLGTTVLMKKEQKRIDTACSDVVRTGIVKTPNHFRKYATKKNWVFFYKHARIPMLIMIFAVISLIIRGAITDDFLYNPYNRIDGFGSLFPVRDFSTRHFTIESGFKFDISFGDIITPANPNKQAIFSYFFVPIITIGQVWFLICCAGYIARGLRISSLAKSIFSKSLEGYNINEQIYSSIEENKQKQQVDGLAANDANISKNNSNNGY